MTKGGTKWSSLNIVKFNEFISWCEAYLSIENTRHDINTLGVSSGVSFFMLILFNDSLTKPLFHQLQLPKISRT